MEKRHEIFKITWLSDNMIDGLRYKKNHTIEFNKFKNTQEFIRKIAKNPSNRRIKVERVIHKILTQVQQKAITNIVINSRC